MGLRVAASLAAGPAVAALLTLAVFPGAVEAVVTGSLLVGFGTGWALLGWLSRRASQRQDWAFVPAGLMSGTGILLMATSPGAGVLSASGWVWPPVMVLCAGFCVVRMRRQLSGAGRWLLYPVLLVLVLASAGGAYLKVVTATRDQIVRTGMMYEIGGRQLHLDCGGSGSPTVVLQGGLGESAGWWTRVRPTLAQNSRVCVFERAGQGWSEASSAPSDGVHAASDLHSVLAVAGETGPYVLVGHSTGGTYAMTYAQRYPDDVAGMVLLDSSSPDQFSLIPTMSKEFAVTRRVIALAPTLSRVGLGELVPASSVSRLPEPAASEVRDFTESPAGWRNYRDEQAAIPQVFRQAQALTSLGDAPLVVVTALGNDTRGWPTAQDRLLGLSTNSSHRFADVDHSGVLDQAEGAAVAIRAVQDAVRAVREASPV